MTNTYSDMMTSSNESIFCIIGPLWGESTGYRWIPLTKASEMELWCFRWSAPERTTAQTIDTPAIWDAIALIMTSLLWNTISSSLGGTNGCHNDNFWCRKWLQSKYHDKLWVLFYMYLLDYWVTQRFGSPVLFEVMAREKRISSHGLKPTSGHYAFTRALD